MGCCVLVKIVDLGFFFRRGYNELACFSGSTLQLANFASIMQLAAVYITFLVSFLGATYGFGCINNLKSYVQQCFVNEGLYFNLTVDDELQLAKFVGSVTQCRQTGAYKNAIECAIEYARICLTGVGMEGMLPDVKRIREGMDFLCLHSKDFDYHCITNKNMDNLQCLNAIWRGLEQGYREANRVFPRNEIMCTMFDIIYDCSAHELRNCPKLTKDVVLELVDKYYLPSMCEDKPPGRPRMSYVEGGAASLTTFFNPFLAIVVSMATLIFLRWSG